MDEESGRRPLARATIVLDGQDQLSASASGNHSSLSSALVELKGKCMEFLGEYLLKQNTPLEEPDEVLGTEPGSDDEEEEESSSRD
ncbi:unnamed protein product [Calypogeia fissa]